MKTHQHATLVGETTGGGAHPGASYRLYPHFEVFTPVGRAINPITNQNWEGSGVIPVILVSQKGALEVAYSHALKSVMASLSEPAFEPSSLLLKEAQAALEQLETT